MLTMNRQQALRIVANPAEAKDFLPSTQRDDEVAVREVRDLAQFVTTSKGRAATPRSKWR